MCFLSSADLVRFCMNYSILWFSVFLVPHCVFFNSGVV